MQHVHLAVPVQHLGDAGPRRGVVRDVDEGGVCGAARLLDGGDRRRPEVRVPGPRVGEAVTDAVRLVAPHEVVPRYDRRLPGGGPARPRLPVVCDAASCTEGLVAMVARAAELGHPEAAALRLVDSVRWAR